MLGDSSRRDSFHTLSSRFLTWRILLCQIYIFAPIISAAHLVYHDVLAELLSTELWGVRPNDAGSANGPDNLQTLQTCACFLWPMSLGANSHTQATGNGRAKQLFLKTSWFLSVLLNGVLHGLAAPQFACFREAI